MAGPSYAVTLPNRDPPRRCNRAAAMGGGRNAVLLVHYPSQNHLYRVRLVVAERLLLLCLGGARHRVGV